MSTVSFFLYPIRLEPGAGLKKQKMERCAISHYENRSRVMLRHDELCIIQVKAWITICDSSGRSEESKKAREAREVPGRL